MVLALCGCLALALIGLASAMAGIFHPVPVFAGTLILGLWLVGVWRRNEPVSSLLAAKSSGSSWVPILLLGLVLVSMTVNARLSSHHMRTERDPGVYVVSARWLASDGDLVVEADPGPFDDRSDLIFTTGGYYDVIGDRGELWSQFLHVLPVFMAAAHWIGGSFLMFKVNAVLGGLALLFFYAFAVRFLRPWAALGATAMVAITLPQLHFTRDAFSEVLAQAFVFGGLWMLSEARQSLSLERGAIAGLALGASAMTRIDAFLYLIPVGVFVAYELVRGVGEPQSTASTRRRFAGAVVAGMVVSAGLGVLDGFMFSPVYVAQHSSQLGLILGGLGAVIVGGAAAVASRARLASLGRWLIGYRRAFATLLVVGIVVASAYALLLRPELEEAKQQVGNSFVESLQRSEGLETDDLRTYAELSFRWLWWYLGPALLAGVAGWALTWYRTIDRRDDRMLPFLLLFSSMTVVYLWKPSITPDQVWAMRRFLPQTIPGLALLSFWIVQELRRSRATLARIAAPLVAVSVLAYPAAVAAPVAGTRDQAVLLMATERVCKELGPDAAVLVPREVLYLTFVQTMRSFCEVPVATVGQNPDPEWFASLAAEWRREGRRLVVVSSGPVPFPASAALPGTRLVMQVEYRQLERTLLGPPDEYETPMFDVFLTEID